MSLEQKRILRYTLLDLVFFFCGFVISLYIAKNYPIDIDISFYGLVLAFSIATFTISTFVCTMNYTGQNKLLILLIEKQGDLLKIDGCLFLYLKLQLLYSKYLVLSLIVIRSRLLYLLLWVGLHFALLK